MNVKTCVILCCLLPATVSHASGQRLPATGAAATANQHAEGPSLPRDSDTRPGPWRPLRIAKWTTLATSAATGIYGFVKNAAADDRYRQLEQLCQDQQFRCADRTAGGAYADAQFEASYQEVRRLDRRSHASLLLSQIGVATSVVLFLLDLHNSSAPGDIPWVPAKIEIAPGAGHVDVAFRLHLNH